MEVAPATLLDRITILRLKIRHCLPQAAVRAALEEELSSCDASFRQTVPQSKALEALEDGLHAINSRLWELEDEVRRYQPGNEFQKAFIKAAREIFRKNEERSHVKDKINRLVGSAFVEVRMHAGPSSEAPA